VHLADRLHHEPHHLGVRTRRQGRDGPLDIFERDRHTVRRCDLGRESPDLRLDIGERDRGEHPAVEVEHVIAGDRVHVRDVGLLLRRFEGGRRGIEERVLLRERTVEGGESRDQVAGRAEGVGAERRRRCVALFSDRPHLDPPERLFRDLDEGALGVARVGHQEHVVRTEQVAVMSGEKLRSVGRAGLLVGAEEQREVDRRAHLALHESAGNQQTRHDGLLIVLDAAPDEPAALDAELKGICGPECALAGRNDVEVRHDPEGSRRVRTAVSGNDVGPHATLGASVRGVEARHLVEGERFQHSFEPHRLVVLPFAATLGAHRGDRRQPALQLHSPLAIPFDPPQ